ncbi:HeH/LEM domain-containing protein [Pseudomonas sp. NPDC088444]|uniref:HeH/LEM domain-containing protein n=1 Tax=Pseudomonas sp. NPDC088444 TaxID=3364456 RepID=UPI0038509F9F
MSDKTLKVKPWGKDQGEFVVIDASVFDESIHTLFDPAGGIKEGSVADIKAKLDALGVEYKAGASKADLQALLDQAHESAQVADLQAKLREKGIDFSEGASLDELKALLPQE